MHGRNIDNIALIDCDQEFKHTLQYVANNIILTYFTPLPSHTSQEQKETYKQLRKECDHYSIINLILQYQKFF